MAESGRENRVKPLRAGGRSICPALARYTPDSMLHRHLNHEKFSVPAIDDVIARGKRADWEELREAILDDPSLLETVRGICLQFVHDPYAQRYHFWLRYVRERETGGLYARQ